jgi:tRNA pseudouridine13 synthase
VIDKAIQTLQQQGFINYYGMQRFGNSTVPTHLIGLALLQSNWKEAARLILSEKSGDSEDVIAARRAWTVDGDAEKSLRNMPKWAVAERCSESYLPNLVQAFFIILAEL